MKNSLSISPTFHPLPPGATNPFYFLFIYNTHIREIMISILICLNKISGNTHNTVFSFIHSSLDT